jgi:hypothetical protein
VEGSKSLLVLDQVRVLVVELLHPRYCPIRMVIRTALAGLQDLTGTAARLQRHSHPKWNSGERHRFITGQYASGCKFHNGKTGTYSAVAISCSYHASLTGEIIRPSFPVADQTSDCDIVVTTVEPVTSGENEPISLIGH